MKPLSKDARNFVNGVVDHLKDGKDDRTGVNIKVQKLLRKVAVEDAKRNVADVSSSIALGAEEKKRIKELVSRLLGQDAVINYHVKPSLIAGIRIEAGEWILDTSVLSQLDEMKGYLV